MTAQREMVLHIKMSSILIPLRRATMLIHPVNTSRTPGCSAIHSKALIMRQGSLSTEHLPSSVEMQGNNQLCEEGAFIASILLIGNQGTEGLSEWPRVP